jgi:hypothetical protein
MALLAVPAETVAAARVALAVVVAQAQLTPVAAAAAAATAGLERLAAQVSLPYAISGLNA